ncbi:MAG: hypothetical protein AAFV45_05105 [Pseudomonadota bacterium]
MRAQTMRATRHGAKALNALNKSAERKRPAYLGAGVYAFVAVIGGLWFGLVTTPLMAAGKKVDPATVTRPSGSNLIELSDQAAALKQGEKLFDSLKLSENGLTCKSCHFKYEAYEKTFLEPYPHAVGMAAKRAGMDQVTADEMVQLCLVVTMDSEPLGWQTPELAALTLYVLDQQRDFQAKSKSKSE